MRKNSVLHIEQPALSFSEHARETLRGGWTRACAEAGISVAGRSKGELRVAAHLQAHDLTCLKAEDEGERKSRAAFLPSSRRAARVVP